MNPKPSLHLAFTGGQSAIQARAHWHILIMYNVSMYKVFNRQLRKLIQEIQQSQWDIYCHSSDHTSITNHWHLGLCLC